MPLSHSVSVQVPCKRLSSHNGRDTGAPSLVLFLCGLLVWSYMEGHRDQQNHCYQKCHDQKQLEQVLSHLLIDSQGLWFYDR